MTCLYNAHDSGFCLETWFHRNTAVSSQVCSVLAARALLILRSVAASSGRSQIYSSARVPLLSMLRSAGLVCLTSFEKLIKTLCCKFP